MWLHIATRAGYDHSFNVSQFIISMNAENVKKKRFPSPPDKAKKEKIYVMYTAFTVLDYEQV